MASPDCSTTLDGGTDRRQHQSDGSAPPGTHHCAVTPTRWGGVGSGQPGVTTATGGPAVWHQGLRDGWRRLPASPLAATAPQRDHSPPVSEETHRSTNTCYDYSTDSSSQSSPPLLTRVYDYTSDSSLDSINYTDSSVATPPRVAGYPSGHVTTQMSDRWVPPLLPVLLPVLLVAHLYIDIHLQCSI